MLTFTSLHMLAMYFFPTWIGSPLISRMPLRTSMHAADFLESIDHLCSCPCDFAITYVHADGPPGLQDGPRVRVFPNHSCASIANFDTFTLHHDDSNATTMPVDARCCQT